MATRPSRWNDLIRAACAPPRVRLSSGAGGQRADLAVITICRNQAEFVRDCIHSVLNQRGVTIEYVVMDGGSTDASVPIVRTFESALAYWQSAPDGGPASALHAGVLRTSAPWITCLNADDILFTDTLAAQLAAARAAPDVDVVYGHGFIAGSDLHFMRQCHSDHFTPLRAVYGVGVVFQPGTIIRRSAYDAAGGFNPANRTSWDLELLIDVALRGARFLRTPHPCGVFRVHPESITGSQRRAAQYRVDRARLFHRVKGRRQRWVDRVVLSSGARALKVLLRCISLTPRCFVGNPESCQG